MCADGGEALLLQSKINILEIRKTTVLSWYYRSLSKYIHSTLNDFWDNIYDAKIRSFLL